MGRWITVRVLAWAIGRGADQAQLRDGLNRYFPRRSMAWRAEVWTDAVLRARRGRRPRAGQRSDV